MERSVLRPSGLPFHYAWVILICCCALSGATLGIVINCKGMFFAPVCAELGCPVSAFTGYTVCYGLSAAVTLLEVDRIFEKYSIRWVLGLSLTALCGATAAMGTFHRLIWWYIAGAIQGVSGAFLLYVPVPMLIHHWFARRRGFALGLSAAFSGILGAVMNPVLGAVISNWGWRRAYFVQGGVSFLLAAPLLALIIRRPEELGLAPYGTAEGERGASSRLTHQARHADQGKLICCLVFAAVFTYCATYAQHLSNFAASQSLATGVGALMVSCCMTGNICAKGILGVCCDRWGSLGTCLVSLSVVMTGFVLLATGKLLFPGAFLLGFDHANMTVMVPVAVSAVSTEELYDHMLSRVTVVTMLTSAFSATVISVFYDLLGSYKVIFLLGGALQVVCMGLALHLFSDSAHYHSSAQR